MSYIFDAPYEVTPAQPETLADFADLTLYETSMGLRRAPTLTATVVYVLFTGSPGQFVDVQTVRTDFVEPESITLTEYVNQASSIEAGVFAYLESVGLLPPGSVDPQALRTTVFGSVGLDRLTAEQLRNIRRLLRTEGQR